MKVFGLILLRVVLTNNISIVYSLIQVCYRIFIKVYVPEFPMKTYLK